MGDNLEEYYQLKKWPWPSSCQLFRRYSFHFLSLNSFILLWKHNSKDIAWNSIQHLFLWETWRKDLNCYFVCLLLSWLETAIHFLALCLISTHFSYIIHPMAQLHFHKFLFIWIVFLFKVKVLLKPQPFIKCQTWTLCLFNCIYICS